MRVKGPLLSLNAAGQLAGRLIYRRARKSTVAYPHFAPKQPLTPAQLEHWDRWRAHAAAWHELTDEEKAALEPEAKRRRLTAYQVWMSQLAPLHQPGNLGYDVVGITSTSWAANYIYAQGPYDLPFEATITQLSAYSTVFSQPYGQATFGIYTDSNGFPDQLKANLGNHIVYSAGDWQQYPQNVQLPADLYWIAIHPSVTWYTKRDTPSDPAYETRYKSLAATPGSLPDPFPAGSTPIAYEYSHFDHYEP